MPEGNRNRPNWIRHSGVGIEFAAAVGAFALLGVWIDRHWDTRPWGLLICVALGLTGASYNLIRSTMKAFEAESTDKPEKPSASDGEPPEQK